MTFLQPNLAMSFIKSQGWHFGVSQISNTIRPDFSHHFNPLTSLRDELIQTNALYTRNNRNISRLKLPAIFSWCSTLHLCLPLIANN
jgi:hypothetical protein